MRLYYSIIVLFCCCLTSFGQQKNVGNERNNGTLPSPSFNTTTPIHDFDLLVNCPTETSMNISVLFYKDSEAYIEYNGKKTACLKFTSNTPQNIELKSLSTDTINRYKLFYRFGNDSDFQSSREFELRTIPSDSKVFSFTVTADSHLDENCSTEIYRNTMLQASKCNPAFHLDLGDTFMVDKYRDDYKKSYMQFIAQRYYFGQLGSSAPLYLVQGNHDGENGDSRRGMTEWARAQRKTFYPTENDKNYYALDFGNTLIIVLDPFGYTPRSANQDPWERTLGTEQYEWLKLKLSNSKALHKFVFIHNLVGGVDVKGKARGGYESAKLYEWGGYSESGTWDFKSHRPGWDMPIHDLLKKYGVKVVFHGHDHVFADQRYDGINYLCIPQPGFRNQPGNIQYAKEYGYNTGTIFNIPGFVEVKINEQAVSINYINSNGELIYSYKPE